MNVYAVHKKYKQVYGPVTLITKTCVLYYETVKEFCLSDIYIPTVVVCEMSQNEK